MPYFTNCNICKAGASAIQRKAPVSPKKRMFLQKLFSRSSPKPKAQVPMNANNSLGDQGHSLSLDSSLSKSPAALLISADPNVGSEKHTELPKKPQPMCGNSPCFKSGEINCSYCRDQGKEPFWVCSEVSLFLNNFCTSYTVKYFTAFHIILLCQECFALVWNQHATKHDKLAMSPLGRLRSPSSAAPPSLFL
jgi:hypothetical protein